MTFAVNDRFAFLSRGEDKGPFLREEILSVYLDGLWLAFAWIGPARLRALQGALRAGEVISLHSYKRGRQTHSPASAKIDALLLVTKEEISVNVAGRASSVLEEWLRGHEIKYTRATIWPP